MGLFEFKPRRTGDLQVSVTLSGMWLRGVPETPQSHIHVMLPPEQFLDVLIELLHKRDTLLRGLHPDINLLAYPCPNCQEPIQLRGASGIQWRMCKLRAGYEAEPQRRGNPGCAGLPGRMRQAGQQS